MIGERISYYRRLRGLKQKELAELIGVTGQTISVWEKGTTSPIPAKYEAIAKALGITITDLLGMNEDTKKEPAPVKEQTQQKPFQIPLNPDVEAALRLRRERPEVTRLLATNEYSDDQIRALAAVPKNEKQG